jgi:hypothetical protein
MLRCYAVDGASNRPLRLASLSLKRYGDWHLDPIAWSPQTRAGPEAVVRTATHADRLVRDVDAPPPDERLAIRRLSRARPGST